MPDGRAPLSGLARHARMALSTDVDHDNNVLT
jgi:hypothetical protein